MSKQVAILDAQGNPVRARAARSPLAALARRALARYDAAQTTADNIRHWINADAASADAAMSASVRRTLRMRARYEIANNTYAKGIILTIANDTVGRGPRLHMQLPPSSGLPREVRKRLARLITDLFFEHAEAVHLAAKLRTMVQARIGDGETFAEMQTNPAIESPVQLDLKVFECDRVASPSAALDDEREVDGVVFDAWDNPVGYRIARRHPGGNLPGFAANDYRLAPARDIVHWFRQDRPEQHRGVSEITPALPLFALLRAFTLAVMDAARNAAHFSGILKTTASPDPDDEESPGLEAMTSWEPERNMFTALPDGYDMGQFEPAQPASTYAEFKNEIINEIARCLNVPFNVAACNSSKYNYASGRLDHQGYFKDIAVARGHCELNVLGRFFRAWLREAVDYVRDLNPYAAVLNRYARWHQWFWDGREHVDPSKVASAAVTLKAAGLLPDTLYWAGEGYWVEDIYDLEVEEREMRRERGLALPAAPTTPAAPAPDGDEARDEGRRQRAEDGEDPDEEDEEEAAAPASATTR